MNERENIRVTCKGKPRLFSKLSWLKDGKKVPQNVMITSEVKSWYVAKSVMRIENATKSDTGNYTCIGNVVQGHTVSTSATVTVRSEFNVIHIAHFALGCFVERETHTDIWTLLKPPSRLSNSLLPRVANRTVLTTPLYDIC